MEPNMARAAIYSQTVQLIRATSSRIYSKERVGSPYHTDNTRVLSIRVGWKVEEFSNGRTTLSTKANTVTTANMVGVNTSQWRERPTRETGKTASETVVVT